MHKYIIMILSFSFASQAAQLLTNPAELSQNIKQTQKVIADAADVKERVAELRRFSQLLTESNQSAEEKYAGLRDKRATEVGMEEALSENSTEKTLLSEIAVSLSYFTQIFEVVLNSTEWQNGRIVQADCTSLEKNITFMSLGNRPEGSTVTEPAQQAIGVLKTLCH